MSYFNNMTNLNNMSYVCRLYKYFYESLKITCFLFLKMWSFFLNI